MKLPPRATRSLPHILVAALFILTAASAPAEDAPAAVSDVIAPGPPELTVEGIERFTGFVEWLLDVPLTTEQRASIEQSLRDSWETGDQEGITGYTDTLQLEEQVVAMSAEDRVLLREQLQPELLKDLQSKPDDKESRWLLTIYEAGHQPIAEGQPALTRQMTDAFVELFCFMLSEAAGQKLDAPAELRDEMAQFLATGYPELTPDAQAEFAQMPLIWAAFQAAWPALSEEEKAAYREQFTEMFRPQLEGLKQAAAEAEAAAAAQSQPAAAAPDQAEAATSLQARYAAMAAQAQYSQMMNNVLQMQANTASVFAANMGNSYRYEYRY